MTNYMPEPYLKQMMSKNKVISDFINMQILILESKISALKLILLNLLENMNVINMITEEKTIGIMLKSSKMGKTSNGAIDSVKECNGVFKQLKMSIFIKLEKIALISTGMQLVLIIIIDK